MCEKSDPRKKPCERSPSGEFPPARLFCGCFSRFEELLNEVRPLLEEIGGPVSKTSDIFPFPETRLYEPTMGRDLKRIFYVFDRLQPQDCLAAIKQRTCTIEEEIAGSQRWPVKRPINLDPGLVSEGRLVLASTKDRGHRLPRAHGIYEEITLLYFNGAFRPLLWTYPDFKSEPCLAFFEAVREEYLNETRHVRRQIQQRSEKKRF